MLSELMTHTPHRTTACTLDALRADASLFMGDGKLER
jgi:hypothetical protein